MSVVGIDLGTTNTVVGCVRAGKVHVLADERGVRLLPSVVSFHPNGEVLVGAAARARRTIDARNTVYSHKRLIGRSWGSPEIVQAKQRLPFELREGPGQGPLVHARGHDYTLPEISAFVLKRARQIAEQALGVPVERAVITVPAHFNELQRASTKVAGRVSGLEVLRILNEPTAAALAYGLGRTGNERVAVYDFGGGTFDCTLLDLNGNVFEVLATAGDSFLGGDDVDNAIADRMADNFLKQHRQDARQDPAMFERLKSSAEEIKIALSAMESHTAVLRDFGHGAGGAALTFQFTMTRADLESLVTPLLERSLKVTQDALALARLSPSSFDKVILVGGSTRIPLVRRRVEAFFGTPPLDRVNPDEVVAIGAAIQAAALTEGIRRKSIPAPPGVPGRRPLDTKETTQTSELDPAMLKPAFGSSPPAFGFGGSPSSRPPPVAQGRQITKPGVAPTTKPFPAPPPARPFAALLGEDPETLTQAAPTEAHAPTFGAIDDPSLVSTPSTSIPSFPSMSAMARGPAPPSPISSARDLAPSTEGAFGAVADLSLISSSGISSPTGTDHEFGHVSDLSLIAQGVGADAETQARPLPFNPDAETQARPLPFNPDATEGPTEAFRREVQARQPGGTVQLEPRANPVAPPAQRSTHDAIIDREDLPAVVARPKPARHPGQVGMGPSGGSAMSGRPPPTTAQQPFGPMERVEPAPQTRAMGPAAPPAPRAPAPARPLVPTDAFGSPAGPAPPPPLPPPTAPSSPAALSAQGRAPSAFPAPLAPQLRPFASAPPPPPAPYASAPPPPPPPPAPYASQPPQPFAFGSAPPPPTTGSAPPQPYAYGAPAPAAPSGPVTLPPGYGGPIPSGAPPGIQYQSPVLVDVTPRGLVVETVGGYCDTIIPRNAKIPCERTRRFATGRDMQTSVRVRVAQGESPGFHQNTYLGEVELSGLRPAPRGEVTVAVTFEVDADGTLRVRARDVQTGVEARATLQLIGVADESSVVMMINRFAQQPIAGGSS